MDSQNWFDQVTFQTAKKWAKKFFCGKYCVASLINNPIQCDWHHLDEDRENNPRIGNLVPLTRDLNQAIEVTPHKFGIDLPKDLRKGCLKETAREHWKNGNFARAYGANRLGSYLAITHWDDPSSAIFHASEALHCLRPMWEQAYAVDTIRRSVLSVLTKKAFRGRISPTVLAGLCKEIGSWFLGAREIRVFFQWKQLGDKLTRLSSAFDPFGPNVMRARLVQHEGIMLFQVGDVFTAKQRLREANEIMRSLAYRHGVSNNLHYFARILLQDTSMSPIKSIDKVGALLEQLQKEYGVLQPLSEWLESQSSYEVWGIVSLMAVKSEYKFRRGRRSDINDAEDLLYSVKRIAENKRIANIELFPDAKVIRNFFNRFPLERGGLMPFVVRIKLHQTFVSVALETLSVIRTIHQQLSRRLRNYHIRI